MRKNVSSFALEKRRCITLTILTDTASVVFYQYRLTIFFSTLLRIFLKGMIFSFLATLFIYCFQIFLCTSCIPRLFLLIPFMKVALSTNIYLQTHTSNYVHIFFIPFFSIARPRSVLFIFFMLQHERKKRH